ncbi:hypothetical protein CLLI_04910 [Clostridium liquoris]|jgi:carboxyl-terminal processing protease|uniref:Uncharacterized protein n=1 Tax=Clostridium liquoris TaxID=1289519 RepID=A0A2T0B8G6_9CLOT|nr:hypothetical protein [Clostridium liquoris]PRR80107.1 hypothetical protein CLLI_04910 [Clostridium liquoris]
MKRGNNKRFLKGFIFTLKGNEIQNVGITPDFNTKDVDSLAVAELLYSGTNKTDKRHMIKVIINNNEFLNLL